VLIQRSFDFVTVFLTLNLHALNAGAEEHFTNIFHVSDQYLLILLEIPKLYMRLTASANLQYDTMCIKQVETGND